VLVGSVRLSSAPVGTDLAPIAGSDPPLVGVTVLADLHAFLQEHRRCGGLDAACWMTCTCGAVINRSATERRSGVRGGLTDLECSIAGTQAQLNERYSKR
jgi:hypothetical protein